MGVFAGSLSGAVGAGALGWWVPEERVSYRERSSTRSAVSGIKTSWRTAARALFDCSAVCSLVPFGSRPS